MAEGEGRADRPRAAWRRLPAGVWALGLVSLWMDVSSEMIHALLPIYLVTAFGASMATVGMIEGFAEATAAVLKVLSGVISDRIGRRKALAALGYGLSAATKPIFALAPALGWVVFARIADRVGKGIRGSPRDALLTALTPKDLRGAAFGLRQSLDTVGAVIGPVLAIVVMWGSGGNFRLVFWIAFLPALFAVLTLVLRVQEPADAPRERPETSQPILIGALARMGGAFWAVIAVAFLFSLARFSEAFLILRAQSLGLPVALAPLIPIGMSIAFALTAYPAGALSDTRGRGPVLALGIAMMIGAFVILALVPSLPGVALAVVLWGAHLGFTQGIFGALVADTAPVQFRGTGFGLLNLVMAAGVFVASAMVGALWDAFGPAAAFLTEAVIASAALGASLVLWWQMRRS